MTTTKWIVALLASLTLVLSACEFTVSGEVTPTEPVAVSINTSSASYDTDYKASIDGRERFVICDDRRTELSYEFTYSGDLIGWTSYLEGVNTGTIAGETSLRVNDNRVQRLGNNRVRVTYTIPANQAPLFTATDNLSTAIDTQGIVVVPNEPTVVGNSRLLIDVDGYRQRVQLISRPIPVIDSCPPQ